MHTSKGISMLAAWIIATAVAMPVHGTKHGD